MDRVFIEYSQLYFSKVVSSVKKVQTGNDSCIPDLIMYTRETYQLQQQGLFHLSQLQREKLA